ncbi:AAA family ATPase [Streptomyces sp. NPDC096040]|uniref:helix-turn-helix transcriptional regulator n=1 Tax=Streptomyces sp. NPDC096040 TaxID=3155541 RepID=UPI00332828FA
MTVQPPQQSAIGAEAVVLGRDGEIERLLRCVTRELGTPQILLVLGEEGIGRTALLRRVRELAAGEGVSVLSAQGWAGDPQHARACLQQLLAPPVLDEVAALPAVPHRVLTAVLHGDETPDEGELRAALTALLDRLAAARPVLVCVDDADLCDRATLEALSAAARLLAGRPLTVLLAARHETALPGLPPGTETLSLGPLDDASAAALLDRQPAPPTGRHRLEILAEAEGNPLALVELSRAAPGPAGAVRRAPAEPVFGVRLDALPADTRRALLYAAAAGPGETVAAVMTALDTGDLAVWAPAETAGLVSLVEDRLVFRHPLARSSAYLRQPAGERQQAHRDLAKVAVLPEVRARHLAAATVGANAFVAAGLETSAWRCGDAVRAARALEQAARLTPGRPAHARRLAEALTAAQTVGDPDWVRDLFGRLLQESAEPEFVCVAAGALASVLSYESAQREAFDLLAAASEYFPLVSAPLALALTALAAAIAAQSGLPEHRASLPTLLERAHRAAGPERGHPTAPGPLGDPGTEGILRGDGGKQAHSGVAGPVGRVGALGPEGADAGERGRPGVAGSLGRVGASDTQGVDVGERGDPGVAGSLGRLGIPGDQGGGGGGRWHPGAAGPLGGLDTPDSRRAMDALVAVVARPETATGALRGLGRPPRAPLGGPDAPAGRLAAAAVAHHADEADLDLGQSRMADDRLRVARAFGLRGWSVLGFVDTLLAIGRFSEAQDVIQNAMTEAAVLRLPRLHADLETQALTLRALRGTLPPEPWLTPAVWSTVSLQENRATHARLLRAHGLAAIARGDWDDGWRQLRELFTADGSPLHPFLSPRSIAELAVAAQRTGRPAEALPILARVREEQGDRPSTRMTLLLHHATALLGPDDEAEEHFQLALVNHAANRWPWECGHVRLNYALWLRRCRRTLEARRQLTTVLETAEHLGAGPLADAARRELRASGAAPAPEAGGPLEQLTAQQREIVQLVARGLSNREIGERLFLSPRTVGSHLYNVYPKLGISSRHQLRDLVQGR